MRPLPHLTIQQLDYLVAVADHDTWSAAAHSRAVSASALSQGLAELERRLGQPLFERVGRRRRIALESAPVLAYARSVIRQTHDLGQWVERRQTGASGQLHVGMIDAAAIEHYPDHLRSFGAQHPEVDVRLTVGPSGGLLDQLRSAQLDIAVVVQPPPEPSATELDGLDTVELMAEELALYPPPGTRVESPDTWGPWVLFPAGSHTRELIDGVLANLGARSDISAESHQPEVLKKMVTLGLGWTILPTVQAEREPDGLSPARWRPVMTRQLIAATRRDALPNPLVDRLLDLLTA